MEYEFERTFWGYNPKRVTMRIDALKEEHKSKLDDLNNNREKLKLEVSSLEDQLRDLEKKSNEYNEKIRQIESILLKTHIDMTRKVQSAINQAEIVKENIKEKETLENELARIKGVRKKLTDDMQSLAVTIKKSIGGE